MDVAYFRHQEAAFLLISGRARAAADKSRVAVEIGREAGMPAMQLPHLVMLGAHALVAAGSREEALARYDQAIAQAAPVDVRSFSVHRDLARAQFALEAGDEAGALAILRGLFAACREAKFYGFMRQTPLGVSRVAALALAHGIETEYVRTLVRLRQLPAPSPVLAEWPWPLSIRTFGAFELARPQGVRSSAPLPPAPASTGAKTPVAAAKAKVVVIVHPPDAQVSVADGALQPQPVFVLIGPNESVNVRAEKKNYVAQTVAVTAAMADP